MSRLTAAQRRRIPPDKFALHKNGRDSYPIEDKTHAEDAVRMAAHANPHDRAVILAHVRHAYPSIHISALANKK